MQYPKVYQDYYSKVMLEKMANWPENLSMSGYAGDPVRGTYERTYQTGAYYTGSSLGDWYDDTAKLLDENLVLRKELEAKSAYISTLIDAIRPGVGADVSVANIFGGGGKTARQFFAYRDKANALYEEAERTIASWDAVKDKIISGNFDKGVLYESQEFNRMFNDLWMRHNKLASELEVIAENPERYAEEHAPPGVLESTATKLLVYGGIGLLIWKYLAPQKTIKLVS